MDINYASETRGGLLPVFPARPRAAVLAMAGVGAPKHGTRLPVADGWNAIPLRGGCTVIDEQSSPQLVVDAPLGVVSQNPPFGVMPIGVIQRRFAPPET